MIEKNTFQKLADTLNILIAKERTNASELARQTGLPPTTIKRFRNNDNSNPTLTSLLPIAKYFSLSISQLIGEDPISLNGELTIGTKKELIQHIPVLSWADAGKFNELDYSAIQQKTSVDHYVSKKTFALKIQHNDFENIPQGYLIITDPGLNPRPMDLVVATKGNEPATLKKIIIQDGTTYLKPLLRGLGATEMTAEHRIIGVVVQAKIEFR